MTHSSIIESDATAIAELIRSRQVSCREVMAAHLAQIHEKNPRHNAIVNLEQDDVLLSRAEEFDTEISQGSIRGPLHGLPIAIKDTDDAAGLPTTRGSRLLADTVPPQDSPTVRRLRAAGCIVIGKTNVPEFALGSHTFNELFGATRNAWDDSVSAGGSSGGAAVAVALGMLPLADGSDLMGSLRNPAGWNNIFGMRPTQRRVPRGEIGEETSGQLATNGPIARSVRDIRLLLGVQSGDMELAPFLRGSSRLHGKPDEYSVTGSTRPLRVAWLGDMNGRLPTDAGILSACEAALQAWQRYQGAAVEPVKPDCDLDEVWDSWLTLRSLTVGPRVAEVLTSPNADGLIKEEALWEYERSLSISAQEHQAAEQARQRYAGIMDGLLREWDVLALPTSQVWPFPVSQRWPQDISGRRMDTYHRWMEASIYASLAGLPSISVPAGFHPNGKWPNGIQLIGARDADSSLLQIAAAYEEFMNSGVHQP